MTKEDNVVKLTVSVSRGDLLSSQQALANLGSLSLPVERDRYWMARTLSAVQKEFKRTHSETQKESNRLIEMYGKELPDAEGKPTGRRGIEQTDVNALQMYAEDMDAFREEIVVIVGARKLPIDELQSLGVRLPLADQAVLHWLLDV